MRKAERTQWAATYLVAAELTKRDYRVGWPMGNAPVKDLLVESPSGKRFEVDVKGGCYKSSLKSYWHLVQETRCEGDPVQSLFFAFVRVDPDLGETMEVFILPHADLLKLAKRMRQAAAPVSRKGTPYKSFTPGFRYSDLVPFRGWGQLPK